MKPVHIVVLLLAGALGGAMIMKVAHDRRTAVPARSIPPPVAQVTPSAEIPATAPAPVPAAVPAAVAPVSVAESKPAPKPVRHEMRKPSPFPPMAPPPPVQPALPLSPTIAPPLVTAAPENVTPAAASAPVPPPPSQPRQVTLNTGLALPVRLVDGLSSERNAPGDTFAATLDKALVVDGLVIAERGARVEGRVIAVDRGGNSRGGALALELTRLHTSDGQSVAIETDSEFQHSLVTRQDTTAKVSGGAVLGAVLLTPANPLNLPGESLVTFHLKTAVPLTEKLK